MPWYRDRGALLTQPDTSDLADQLLGVRQRAPITRTLSPFSSEESDFHAGPGSPRTMPNGLPNGAQGAASAATNDAVEAADVGLDDDPETTLVGSIFLHLLSEHGVYHALSMSDDDAIAFHDELHTRLDGPRQRHPVTDWRFRPKRALATSMRSAELSHQLAQSGADVE